MPATTATARTARLEKLIARLTRTYHRRRLAGRDCSRLLIRNRQLSAAYCDSMEALRNLPL